MHVDRAVFILHLPASKQISVRLDQNLQVVGKPAGRAGRRTADVLEFRRGRDETGSVTGDPARLDLIEEVVANRMADDVSGILLPKDLVEFEQLVASREIGLADHACAVRASARASAIACSIGTCRRLAASLKTWPYTRAVKPGSAWPMCAATSVTGRPS